MNATSKENRRTELSIFLRRHRARLSPSDVGLVASGRRRTPGLRREEVAALANVGLSWYTWLEQGRPINVSSQVLDAISRALRLDDAERIHLRLLAGVPDRSPNTQQRSTVRDDLLQYIVDGFREPAYIVNRHWCVEVANIPARNLLDVRAGTNCLVRFFTEDGRAQRYCDPEATARSLVGRYRLQVARYVDDPVFAETARRLCRESEEFAALWDERSVCAEPPELLAFRHEEFGRIDFRTVSFPLGSDPSRALVLQIPESGYRSTGSDTPVRIERVAG
ncbi:helix-turn-helix transcriptional regulator [Rhodococcus aetherivorans]|uniref:helix-turn-helix transcriptional regulator n=1 Tax=Rhodococcus aetherivorans TaxID=191292 RepID=UPI0031E2EF52